MGDSTYQPNWPKVLSGACAFVVVASYTFTLTEAGLLEDSWFTYGLFATVLLSNTGLWFFRHLQRRQPYDHYFIPIKHILGALGTIVLVFVTPLLVPLISFVPEQYGFALFFGLVVVVLLVWGLSVAISKIDREDRLDRANKWREQHGRDLEPTPPRIGTQVEPTRTMEIAGMVSTWAGILATLSAISFPLLGVKLESVIALLTSGVIFLLAYATHGLLEDREYARLAGLAADKEPEQ